MTCLQGNFYFRSLNNLKGESTVGERDYVRKRHNFIDDLESFFWVFFWIILSQDGPGPQNARFDTCYVLSSWSTAKTDSPRALQNIKLLPMSGLFIEEGDIVYAPYFAQPPYINLHKSLCLFLNTLKIQRNKSSVGSKDGGTDYFPEIDKIYGEVLSLFDVAIEEVGKHPTSRSTIPPLSISLVEEVAPLVNDIADDPMQTQLPRPTTVNVDNTPAVAVPGPIRRIQPDRCAKRPREEAAHSSENKKAKLGPLLARSHRALPPSTSIRIEETPRTTLHVPVGTRRSERLQAMQVARSSPRSPAPIPKKRKAGGTADGRPLKKGIRRS